jgi:VIT1/CCC1 family predicted Fe2+/Mn2+ transporter
VTELNFAAWFVDTASLAAVIVAATAFIRKHLLPLDGWQVIACSLVVGALLGVAGHVGGLLTEGLASSVVFGVSAGLLASGGVDGIRAVLDSTRRTVVHNYARPSADPDVPRGGKL